MYTKVLCNTVVCILLCKHGADVAYLLEHEPLRFDINGSYLHGGHRVIKVLATLSMAKDLLGWHAGDIQSSHRRWHLHADILSILLTF